MRKVFVLLVFAIMVVCSSMTVNATSVTTKFSSSWNTDERVEQGTKVYYHVRKGVTNPNPDFVAEGEVITLQDAALKKYLFKGWYLDAKYTKKAPETITGVSGKGLHLYGKFEFMNLSLEWIKAKNVKTQTLKISYSKVDLAKGYEVKISSSKKFKAKNTSTYTTKKTTYKAKKWKGKRLKKGSAYYMKVRAYAIDSTGKKAYGLWSKPAKFTIYQ